MRHRNIRVTAEMVAATLPWFGIVGVAYAVHQSTALTGSLSGLIATPTAYLTVGSVVVGLWITLERTRIERYAFVTATGGLLALVSLSLGIVLLGTDIQSTTLLWNGIASGIAVVITVVVRTIFLHARDRTLLEWLGVSVLFAHVLDATTTGIGLTILGVNERNPLSAFIIHTADTLVSENAGILVFLVVKIGIALLLVSVLGGRGVHSRRDTAALFVFAAGAGLAPAVHNLVLFTLTVH